MSRKIRSNPIDDFTRSFVDAVLDELQSEVEHQLQDQDQIDDSYRLVRAKPVNLRIKRTLKELCQLLAHIGFRNRYYEHQADVEVSRVKAVTLHIERPNGEEETCLVVLDPFWTNPDS